MTAVEPGGSSPAPPVSDDAGSDRPLIGLCPYLAAESGAWRSATPAREHRCGAVTPAAPLAAEKQRRLCLTPEHVSCATYEAARSARWVAPDRASALPRPVARTTPVVLDRGRLNISVPAFRPDRSTGQGVLVGLLGIAFVAIVLAKVSSSDGALIAAGASSSPPRSAPVASATPVSKPTASTGPAGSNGPTGSGAASGAPSTAPTPRPTTYTVRAGNTLAGIAKKFGTTAAILAKLNNIKDPTKLKVGQVLKLPPA